MNFSLNNRFKLETDCLSLRAELVPWDTEILGYPVAQIEHFELFKPDSCAEDFAAFENWLNSSNCGMASCRLGYERLVESMLLEAKGFRFIELVLHPECLQISSRDIPDQGLKIERASEADLPVLKQIAETAFKKERFHADPRIDSRLADLRYARWVESAVYHPRQELLKIRDDHNLIAFFIIEAMTERKAYWHLTAVSPQFQGKGYGRRTWLSMLRYHKWQGHKAVSTTISARNTIILNLYASLNFRFRPPEMTFHWLKKTK